MQQHIKRKEKNKNKTGVASILYPWVLITIFSTLQRNESHLSPQCHEKVNLYMLTSPRMQSKKKKKKKLMEWDQAKPDQTQKRLQLLWLHVNGSQMRKVSKRWDSQPLSTNWICVRKRQRRRWIISLVAGKRDSECSETLRCPCNEARRCNMLYVFLFFLFFSTLQKWARGARRRPGLVTKRRSITEWSSRGWNQWSGVGAEAKTRPRGFHNFSDDRVMQCSLSQPLSRLTYDLQSWRRIPLVHTGQCLPEDQTPAAITPRPPLDMPESSCGGSAGIVSLQPGRLAPALNLPNQCTAASGTPRASVMTLQQQQKKRGQRENDFGFDTARQNDLDMKTAS